MRLPIGDHGQEAAARVIVLGMRLQMLREFLDALGKYGNLHFRRAGVRIMNPVLGNELLLLGLGNHFTSLAQFAIL